jgi:hydrogenase maturation protease
LFDMPPETDTGPAIGAVDSNARKVRVLVVGVGNILLKDEGVGVHVARKLQELALPNDVEVIDAGTSGLDILLLQENVERLIVIDATRAGNKAGTIYKARLMAGEMEKLTQLFYRRAESKISLHQIGLIEALAAARKLKRAPKEIVIIGVEPDECDLGLELTESVARSIPEVIKKVLEETENVIHREQADR